MFAYTKHGAIEKGQISIVNGGESALAMILAEILKKIH